jgi:SAM-dependent methyltransferase
MRGIDLSSEMLSHARRLNPDINFTKGNILALDLPAESLAGIVTFYAIIHLKRRDVVRGLKQMHDALKPGGQLLVSFHGGEGNIHRDSWYDKPVSIDVTLMGKAEMTGYLELAGFKVDGIVERPPYDFEYPTPRLYARAKRNF